MQDPSPITDPAPRTERCAACGRPVWAPLVGEDEAPKPPPELCDYCAAAAG